MKLPSVLTLLLLPLAVQAADVGDTALRRCRGLADAAARLACYDALPLAPVAPAAPAAAATPATPMAAAPTAGGAAPVAAAAAPKAAPVLASMTPAAAPAPEANFGLENQRAAVQAISSSIPGIFEGWDGKSKIRLANGQVWQITDGSTAALYLRDPKVKVERAALGSFRLEIEGTRQAPRVQRVE